MKPEEIPLQLKLKHYKITNASATNYLSNRLNTTKKPLKLSNYLNKMLPVILQMEIHLNLHKCKHNRNLFQEHQIKSFLALASEQQEQSSGNGSTLAEKVLGVLQGLESELEASLENLKQNEINASWELAGWVSLSEAEITSLEVEYERKQVFADRTATQIQAALAQQAKSKIILQESQDALDQAQSDLESKRADYEEAKAKRNEENAILDEVIIMFKKQVASWSGR
ncbi:unnamed protein product (macronuclear) [Paramecium tetraurelia]|uniref:Uncharacterized protein n=1 Tax=Paramecium tetraurelia TaxID=5888 RepID=A0E7X7_PARTE|nr:uncharacterized protein GSPATT00024122001 [Paramecium tetraurelia]CAK91394.1 unnamed protein product [Paramecium tetraurelia]|eukprot:XP_001458791.1 hypothetical protein (macronuclear) [Paramecium tetraurelia strain d4-2]